MNKLAPLLLALIAWSLPAIAGDVERGAEKAQSCVQCHGELGNTPIANYPKIAGQAEKYLLFALRSYQNGKRKNLLMTSQIQNLTGEDLSDLAAYFASQKGDLK